MKNLLQDKILSCGTIRANRKGLPKDLKSDKQLARGESDIRQGEGLNLVKWMDNKSVLVVSTCCGPVSNSEVERRQKGKQEKIKIICPDMIKDYNQNMGGVDIMDQKLASYGVDRRARIKFYLRPFFDLLNIAMTNSFVVWMKLNPTSKMTSLEFRRSVTRELILSHRGRERMSSNKASRKRGAVSYPSNVSHLPVLSDIRKRCRLCADQGADFKTDVTCATCKNHLCLTKNRNCFHDFHE